MCIVFECGAVVWMSVVVVMYGIVMWAPGHFEVWCFVIFYEMWSASAGCGVDADY